MPPRATKRQGTIKSFDAFRVSKPTILSNAKNVKSSRPSRAPSDITISPRPVETETAALIRTESSEDSPLPILPPPNIVRPELDEDDAAYLAAAKVIRQAKQTPVLHTQPNTIETILRDFDMTGKYGPCVGITRLERFNRAKKMKMAPPVIVGQILETQQAHDRTEYKHEVRNATLPGNRLLTRCHSCSTGDCEGCRSSGKFMNRWYMCEHFLVFCHQARRYILYVITQTGAACPTQLDCSS